MASIIERTKNDGTISRYVLVGAGKVPSNYGSGEKDFLVGCTREGCVKVLSDYKCKLRIVDIDGKTPAEILDGYAPRIESCE